ncbi:tautomerase family protein [Streptomyces sp. RB6PN25]|uniref:Tautomerase family protein n=1 Tax=Streptomyces humicola TaxID=2953240 RepID=A0ABT1PRC1_9ACTN|nr:tautomerase family protein [Streptomyces humicola]MCQ4079115.1 tautomerase family protein [Streptomyces humicola]
MPLIEVTLVKGRTPKQIRSLIRELHEAVVRAVDAPPENVRVVVREVPPTHWAAGNVTIAERRAGAELAAQGRSAVDNGGRRS